MGRTTNTYATRDEAIEREIIPLLGEWVDEFDVEGLAGALIHSGHCTKPHNQYSEYRFWVEVPGGDNIGAVLADHHVRPDTGDGS